MAQKSVVQGREQMMQRMITEESHHFEEIIVDVIAVHYSFELVHAPVDSSILHLITILEDFRVMMSSVGTYHKEYKTSGGINPQPHNKGVVEGRTTGEVHPDGKKETNAIVPSVVAFEEALADEIADEPLCKVDHKHEWEHHQLNQEG